MEDQSLALCDRRTPATQWFQLIPACLQAESVKESVYTAEALYNVEFL